MPDDTKRATLRVCQMEKNMGTLLSILALIMQMRNMNSHSDSYEDKAAAFRSYWLDPNYSFKNSDSSDFFGSKFDYWS